MTGEDFQDGLRTEVHDEANRSSLAALDAEEANLEDTIRASIAEDIARHRLTHLAPVTDRWTRGYRHGLERAETIARGESS